jgi:hypothetical protein
MTNSASDPGSSRPGDGMPAGGPPTGGAFGNQPPSGGAFGTPPPTGSSGMPPAGGGSGLPPAGGPVPGTTDQKPRKVWPFVVCGGCAVLAILVVIALVVIYVVSSGTEEEPEPVTSPTVSQTPGDDEERADGKQADGKQVDDQKKPDGDEKSDGGKKDTATHAGTRKDPLEAGATVKVPVVNDEDGSLDVSLGTANVDADAEVAKQNEFNDTASSGNKYMIVPVTVTYHGDGSSTPWIDVQITYVSADGHSYSQASSVLLSNDGLSTGEIYDGASVTYDIPFEIPKDDTGDGAFKVAPFVDFDDDAKFVAATS